MKQGFTFNWANLKFLGKVIFKNFGGGGENRKRALLSSEITILQNVRKLNTRNDSFHQGPKSSA